MRKTIILSQLVARKKWCDVIYLLAPKKHPVNGLGSSEGWTHRWSWSSDTWACSVTWCCFHAAWGEVQAMYLGIQSSLNLKDENSSFSSHIASTNLYTYSHQPKSCQQALAVHPLNARGCARHGDKDLNRLWPSRSLQSNEEKYMKINLTVWIDTSSSRGSCRGWSWEENRLSARDSWRVARVKPPLWAAIVRLPVWLTERCCRTQVKDPGATGETHQCSDGTQVGHSWSLSERVSFSRRQVLHGDKSLSEPPGLSWEENRVVFFFFSFKYSWFTMLHWFLLYSKVI